MSYEINDADVFALEGYMISFVEWDKYIGNLPEEYQDLKSRDDANYGFGYQEDVGYFILASQGQGPCFVWSEPIKGFTATYKLLFGDE